VNTSQAGLAFLEGNEGRVLRVYTDVAGIPTAGVGHVVLPEDGLKLGDPITEAQCEAFLARDVAKCEAAIAAHVTRALTQNECDALVSLIFNIGVGAFATSTVLRVINGSTEMPLAEAWELWDKDVQGGAKAVDAALLARRKRELALYLTPDAPSSPFTGAALVLPDPLSPEVPDEPT
jgi:lysozyme